MTSPRRATPRGAVNPIATLLFVAAFPTVVLFGVWRYAQSQDDSAPPAPDAVAELPTVLPRTPVLSARRTPSVLARETSSVAFEGALRPLGGAVLPGSCAGVLVDGAVALADGIDTPVTPASTLKVVVAAVALEVLGPDYVFTTEVRAEIVDGSVGSLYLIGGGDPLLAASWYPDNADVVRYPQLPATSLDALAEAVRSAGVTQVAGNVIGDRSRYDDELYPPTWPINFRATEGGPIGALVANDALVLGENGRSADPAVGAAKELVRLLRDRGVVVAGQATSGVTPAGPATIASISSAPLAQIVGEMLQNSDNNTAEMLLKEIGRVAAQSGTRSAGTSVVVAKLAEWGVPTDGVVIVDGSGLSRDNKLSCSTVLGVLGRFTARDFLFAALPVAGRTGTLAQYFVGDPLQDVLRGKTGSLTDVKGLVGYVPIESGGLITFAVLLEGVGVAEDSYFRPIWEGYLSDALGSYPSGPTADRLAPLPATPMP